MKHRKLLTSPEISKRMANVRLKGGKAESLLAKDLCITDEKGNSRYLYRLFPKGPAKQATKIAGLPKPVKCI